MAEDIFIEIHKRYTKALCNEAGLLNKINAARQAYRDKKLPDDIIEKLMWYERLSAAYEYEEKISK
jgi:hypothetical protein